MSSPPPPSDAADLARHAAGVRRLARRLVGASDAEDLAQDAWVRAMTHPPRAGYTTSGWLRGIVRNVARERWRSESRRTRREERARPTTAPQPDVVDAVGGIEQVRVLADALARLPEAYRAVVWWRYFANRTPKEIGVLLGEPAATVRTRLKRALERLRTDLDAVHGEGDAGWRAALLPLAGLSPVASIAQWSAVSALLLLLIGLGAGLFVWAPWSARDPAPDDAPPDVVVADRPTTLTGRPRDGQASASEAVETRSVRVTVLAADTGAVISGARLELLRHVPGVGSLRLEDGRIEGATDDAGEALLHVDHEGALAVRTTAHAFLPAHSTPVPASSGRSRELQVLVRMQRGATLGGHVLLPDGTVPNAPARVRVSVYRRGTSGPVRSTEVMTEPTGRFLAVGLVSGAARIGVAHSEEGRRYVGRTMAQTGDLDVVLTLHEPEPGDSVPFHVRLQDAEGAPVEAGGVRIVTRRGPGLWMDTFEGMSGLGAEVEMRYDPGAEVFVEVFDVASGRWGAMLHGPLSMHEPGVVLTVEDGRAVDGVVRGPTGEPVEDVRVAARCLYPVEDVSAVVGSIHVRVATDAHGRFTLRGLARADYRLEFAVPPGFAHPGEMVVPMAESEVAVDLAVGTTATLTVVDDDDRPVEGAQVGAHSLREGARPSGSTSKDMVAHYETISAGMTDAAGGVRLTGFEAGRTYTLLLQGPGTGTRRRLQQDDWEAADGTWMLGDVLRIHGHVTYPDGTPAGGSHVTWWREGEHSYHSMPVGDAKARFRIQGVARGPWQVRATSPGGAHAEPMTVEAGSVDVLLVVPRDVERWIRVTDWRLRDAQTVGLLVLHHEHRDPERVEIRMQDDGRIDLIRYPGARAFSLWLGPLDGGRHVYVERQELPERGETRVDASFGDVLEGRLVAPPGVNFAALTVEIGAPFRVAGVVRPTDWIVARCEPDGGTFRASGVPPLRTVVRARGYAAGVEYVAETEASPGEHVTLTLEPE